MFYKVVLFKVLTKYFSGFNAFLLLINGAARLFYLNVLLGFISASSGILIIYLIKLIADKLKLNGDNFDIIHGISLIKPELFFIGLLLLVIICLKSICKVVSFKYLNKISNNIYKQIHKQSLKLDISFFENTDKYEKLHRALSECSFRPSLASNHIKQLLSNLLSLILITGILISLDKNLLLIILVTSIPAFLINTIFSSSIYSFNKVNTPRERRSEYYNYLLTDFQHAKELRLLGTGDLFRKRFSEIRIFLHNKKIRIFLKSEILLLTVRLAGIILILIYYYIVYIKSGYYSDNSGNFFLLTATIYKSIQSIENVFISMSGIYEDKIFLSNIKEFLSLKSKLNISFPRKQFPEKLEQGIKITDLSFSYPDTNSKVLNKVNLFIRPGELTAITGPNGSGKSTLIKLLTGLYMPDSGEILIENTNLKNILVSEIQKNTSLLSQDFYLFFQSIKENIWFGNIHSPLDFNNVKSAAGFSGTNKLISGLDKGYDTYIGKSLEKGIELSKGEYQKIALSRAIYRNSKILILDEPCCSIDPLSEKLIYKNLKKLINNRIIILITHKKAGLEAADKIIYFPVE